MLFGLKPEYINAINQIFAQYPAIEQAIIYGSRANGNYRNGSDIDLTLIGEELSFSEQMEIENKLDDLLLPYKIDLSQKRHLSNPEIVDHINRIGQEFFRKNK